MHGDLTLGGPVWWFVQALVLSAIVLAVFVLIDSLTPRRRARVGDRLREPLWLYAVVSGSYLVLLIAVQVIPGIQLAAAIAAIATPFALAVDFVYLLRVVFPRSVTEEQSSRDGRGTTG